MRRSLTFLAVLMWAAVARAAGNDPSVPASLDRDFNDGVRPFLQQYCVTCHGKDKAEGDLDLGSYATMGQAAIDSGRWSTIVDKLTSGQMPPRKAKVRPPAEARGHVIEWFRAATEDQALRHAGDPGIVPVRRLSNAEFDDTIRDLTGVDIRPAREFPVDPANPAGFDNSGESLTMSPSLLKKYLEAAHLVASHLVLQPDGFGFAPHPMLADTDRDKYCVQRIINFYHAQDIDYADYFESAWRFKHRAALGQAGATLADIAHDAKVSAKYLALVWQTLELEPADVGPAVKLQAMWKALPDPAAAADQADARGGCERMRDYVAALRRKVEPRFLNIAAGRIGTSAEPLLIWKNVQYATHRMTFDPAQLQVEGEAAPAATEVREPGADNEFGPGHTVPVVNAPGDPDLAVPAGQRGRYEDAFARFCRIFPDRFYMEERGRNYFDTTKDRGRYLSAGFHSLLGYFRDDQPLYELLLSDDQQKALDAMWRDLDFVASASSRTYIQFCAEGQRGERSIAQTERGNGAAADAAAEETDVTAEARIRELEQSYLAQAADGDPRGLVAIKQWFEGMNARIRWTEQARRAGEPAQVDALVRFAGRAYRRPLSKADEADVRAYYRSCRSAGLDQESAMREGIVDVLMSPDFCYRLDLLAPDKGERPLTDAELACRLSYFLWSSMPDDALLARAAAGELHEPRVLLAETSRMLHDPRVRALATDFGASWLDVRRFDEITTVDRGRFPTFTSELRQAMYEEPIRFLVDAFQSNRSMLDLLYGNYTFVNPVLAQHYGMPMTAAAALDEWVRIDDAGRYGRGGLLPMAAFLTKNAPGLRTSPVKRGNWVVKNILGERIPAPPPNVPELPHDEAKLDLPLRDMLARHRQDPSCAACHARFDSLGLVFEGFGPVGERREHDLAGRAIDASATFPDGSAGAGLAGLQQYIREHRQRDFTDNLSRKLLAYALGRSPIPSDELLVRQINERLEHGGHRLNVLIEGIVTSPQFLNKRGREQVAER